jgi:hypothetical protein
MNSKTIRSFSILICILVIANTSFSNAVFQSGSISLISQQTKLQIVNLAYPTAQLNSAGSIVIPQSNGSIKTLVINALSRKPVANGFLYVSGIDIKEDQDKVATQLSGATAVPNGSANSKIVVIYINAQGQIAASNVGVLDPNAPSTAISDFYWTNVPTDGTFPVIRLLYSASYKTPTWFGMVRWAVKVNTADMSMQERVPVSFVRNGSNGAVKQDYLSARRVNNSTIQIVSGTSGSNLQYQCGTPCLVDGIKLLNSL